MKELKDEVKEYIEKNNLTQKEFAEKVSVSQGTISAITRGAIPSFSNLIRIRTLLDRKAESDTVISCIPEIKRLFNKKILNIYTANWLQEIGYAVICNDGKVTNIVKEN